MRAIKPLDPDVNVHDSWAWAYPTYSLDLKKEVSTVVIDPLQKMADVKRENNSYATEN